jgi:hypothetical protein
MNIGFFFDKRIWVYRLSSEASDMEGYELLYSNVPFHIQPLDDTYGQNLDGVKGKDFIGACANMDIKEHDKIRHNEEWYLVEGIDNYELKGSTHMELRIRLLSDETESES